MSTDKKEDGLNELLESKYQIQLSDKEIFEYKQSIARFVVLLIEIDKKGKN